MFDNIVNNMKLKGNKMKSELEEARLIQGDKKVTSVLESLPSFVIIVNKDRRIIYANRLFLDFVRTDELVKIVGERPGQVIRCVNAHGDNGECGTSDKCSVCGALSAVKKSQMAQDKVKQEARLMLKSGDSLDVMVWANPMTELNPEYTLVTMTDISGTKRKTALERIFFHDIINTAGSLRNYVEMMQDNHTCDDLASLETTKGLINRLIDEIKEQRDLLAAENGELIPHPVKFSSSELLNELQDEFSAGINEVVVKFLDDSEEVEIYSDRVLLRRVLSNLIRNAVEASKPGQRVLFGSYKDNSNINFVVKNAGYIPKEIQFQIFQRSFSTKGKGRGLGTYGIKLLTERYLKGSVDFISDLSTGTIFWATYPQNNSVSGSKVV